MRKQRDLFIESISSCDSSKSLYCISSGNSPGVCICAGYMFWNGTTCVSDQTVNTTCSDSSQCRVDLGLTCISNICSCNASYYWSGSKCSMWCSLVTSSNYK